jgi:hypothetical protein
MATTTNYGWTTPNDTDLVKDGAAAIRTLGSSIDTTVFNNAGASIAKTIVDAKGDIIAATASDTVSRLAVGANNTVLTADSTEATGLKWAAPAGGANWTLLNAGGTALTGATTITVSGISSKDKIFIHVSAAGTGTASDLIRLRFNADTGNNYNFFGFRTTSGPTYNPASFNSLNSLNQDSLVFGRMSDQTASTVSGYALLTGCAASGVKPFQSVGAGSEQGGNNQQSSILGGFYNSASTISSISVVSLGSNFNTGSVFVYTSA